MGGLLNATLEEKIRYNAPKWYEKVKHIINATEEDIVQAALANITIVEDLASLLKASNPNDPSLKLLSSQIRSVYNHHRGRGPKPELKAPTEVSEAMLLINQYQKLLDEESQLEARLHEIKEEKAKLAPVANVMRSLSDIVRKVKDATEVRK